MTVELDGGGHAWRETASAIEHVRVEHGAFDYDDDDGLEKGIGAYGQCWEKGTSAQSSSSLWFERTMTGVLILQSMPRWYRAMCHATMATKAL